MRAPSSGPAQASRKGPHSSLKETKSGNSTPDDKADVSPALVALVRLLARQVVRETLTDPLAAGENGS